LADGRPDHLTWRLRLLAGIVALSLVALLGRLAMIQIVDHAQYTEEAAVTHHGVDTVPAARGVILDATGFPLATSVDTWDVYIDAFLWQQTDKATKAALQLSGELNMDPKALLAAGTARQTGDVVVRRQLPYSQGQALDRKDIWGVRLVHSSQRIYPEGDLAGPLVGYVGLDGKGLWGAEADFDPVLAGKAGLISSERDALGRPISFAGRTERDPVAGAEVQLTIDRFIQGIAERNLTAAVQQYHAKSGSIVIMNPNTGAILAMANSPSAGSKTANLDDPRLFDRVRDRAVTDMYEPGSVLKTLTTAAAIDLGKVTPNSTYNDTGRVVIGNYTIMNWDFSANGTTTVTEYLQKSLNTGSVWLSGLVGAKDFYRYLQAFGLGEPTHLGLSGEADGLMRLPADPAWSPIDLATNSYGQGLAATPIQVLSAINVFANGGRLMRPYIVSSTVTAQGVRTFQPVEVRRPVTEQTARTVGALMHQVVDGVDYHGAHIPGYQVAGKTGTTLVSIPTGYDLDSTIASFAGFIPYQDPRISVLVKIDQPTGGLNLGGQVAAPVFAKVAAEVMQYMGVAPSTASDGRTAAAR
jgi:cell division protein FtsI (penicillin-binding protein 3)